MSPLARFASLAFAMAITAAVASTAEVARATPGGISAPDVALPVIAANDNTVAAGDRSGDVVRLALVARRGRWYPDGPRTTALPVEAFGEANRPLQIPGPLLRAPLGTRVIVTIRNDLGHDLIVHGFAAPNAATSTLFVPPRAVRTASFVLDRVGTYGYYGSDDRSATHDGSIPQLDERIFRDAELSGAIVVEKPGAPRVDHVFVLGVYGGVKLKDGSPNFLYLLETIFS